MNDKDIEYKEKLLASGIFRRVGVSERYTCQCPFCNDNKRHMYVLIRLTDDTPCLYRCFKCEAKGKMNKQFLEYFGIDNISIPRTSTRRKIDIGKASTTSNLTLVNENDTYNINFACSYIESRVGHYPSIAELQYFQLISNPQSYANEFLGDNKESNYFKDRSWFKLTNGNIMGRYKDDTTNYRWLRYKSQRVTDKGLYTFKMPFDLYQPINVYIAEGAFDLIGLYYNHKRDNNIYIASLGRDYVSCIRYLISIGIFGISVNIFIFKDADVPASSIYINKNMRSLFNKIDIYQNILAKDYGVMPNDLEIQKCII